MRRLRFVVLGKNFTTFTETTISFLRDADTTKPHLIPYTNGNGFQVANGTVFFTEGIDSQVGYIEVYANGDQAISGTGTLNVHIRRYPSSTQAADARAFTIDGSMVKINFTFNSKPTIQDVDIEVNNRTPRTVYLSDFDGAWADFDNDAIAYLVIINSDNNLRLSGAVYTPGTPIPVGDINAGKLVYHPDDVDNQYNDDYQYFIIDSQGNSSE